MDVPEASKHVKKSTSQKLEDQKKVIKRKNLVFLPSLLPLPWNWILLSPDVRAASQKTNQKTTTLASPDVHLYSHASLGMCVVGSWKIADCCCFCIPTWCCASYLLIAIYKGLGGWGPPPSIFDLGLHGVAMGGGGDGAQPGPSGTTHLFFVWDAICVAWRWIILWKWDKWLVCKAIRRWAINGPRMSSREVREGVDGDDKPNQRRFWLWVKSHSWPQRVRFISSGGLRDRYWTAPASFFWSVW